MRPPERFKESVIEDRRKSAEVLLLFATRCHHLANSAALQQFLAVSDNLCVLAMSIFSLILYPLPILSDAHIQYVFLHKLSSHPVQHCGQKVLCMLQSEI